ncbi:MAG: RluA family pseudouridine synthase [Flavobacteriales bacterium]|jgi:23S rRNA pseudouridine1911/1915/1917 synthase|nr:RluA family pseudouridine synthase [Flavobacteriales bacterium]
MAPASIPVLFSDPWLLAVRKPAGVPVQADPTGDEDLLSLVRIERKEPALELVHRIDRPVSGVVLLARTAEANKALQALFRERRVEKRYWAIVEGRVEEKGSVALVHRLAQDAPNRRARVSEVQGDEASRTQVQVLARGDRYSLVECMPEGGAFHQIRAQLSAWGHAIKGDVKYGARRGEKDRSIGLHAREIRFVHPFTGESIRVAAQAPELGIWPALCAAAGFAPSE